MPPDDLIDRCIKGDKRAWDEFVGRYSKLVFWAVKHRLGRFGYNFSEEDVKDIHQDVFFFVYTKRKLAQLKDKSKVAGWLAMVAATCAADYMRNSRRQSPPDAMSIYANINRNGDEFALEGTIAADAQDPPSELDRAELKGVAQRTINALPAKERLILTLNLLENKKHREISEMLNMPANTVSTIISRAKEELKRRLEDIGYKIF